MGRWVWAGAEHPPAPAWAGCCWRLHVGAGIEMCWHRGAATGDAVRCSLCPQGPPPTYSVPPELLYSVCRCPHLPSLGSSGVP